MHALIENGVVTNVIVWDGQKPYSVPQGKTLVDISNLDPKPGKNWTYDGADFTAPPPEE